jgi:hypothetical protein
VTLSRSSGNPELDRAALEQARERVRLEGAGSGESFPIDIDFVQPGSRAADRARERGDRRSITITEPDPEPTIVDVPNSETSPDNDSPVLEAEPSPVESSPTPTPEPATASETPDLLDLLNQSEAAPEPQDLPETAPSAEETNELPPIESVPEFVPELEPEFIPEPTYTPELNLNSAPELTAPEPIPDSIQE